MTILVIDIGLTNAKTIIFSADGRIADSATIATKTYRDRPGWVEQDPADWWDSIVRGLQAIRERHPDLLETVAAISVTGHMHALVCIDRDGRPVGRSLVLGDVRALPQSNAVIDAIGLDTLYGLTGARMDASMPLAKIRWLKENEPDRFEAGACFTGCKDSLRMRMTGDRLSDPMDATGMAMFDINRGQWSARLCEAAGIRQDRLPQVKSPCEIAGVLRPEPARDLGLKPGIKVVVGAGDDVEVLGFGLDTPGQALEHLGTTGSILACTATPVFDHGMAVEVYPHLIPGLWLSGGSINAAGAARAWAIDLLGHNPSGTIPRAPNPGEPLVFIPHLAGARSPNWNSQARAGWIGLSFSHTPQDLVQSVQEGVLFTLRSVLDAMRGDGCAIDTLRVSRKEDESDEQLHWRATVYNRTLEVVACPEPTAQGAMMLAAVALGWYPDLPAAVANLAHVNAIIEPDRNLAADYDCLYRHYLEAERRLRIME